MPRWSFVPITDSSSHCMCSLRVEVLSFAGYVMSMSAPDHASPGAAVKSPQAVRRLQPSFRFALNFFMRYVNRHLAPSTL